MPITHGMSYDSTILCHSYTLTTFCESSAEVDINAGAREGLTLRMAADVNKASGVKFRFSWHLQ